ncbi:MAG: thiamine phosphate synthase [Hyphomicrobiaceae bacterium]
MPTKRAEFCLEVDAADDQLTRLTALLMRVSVASVLIRPPKGRVLDARMAQPFVAAVQKAGAAAIIADDARLARTIKADGVHLTVPDDGLVADNEAREILGRRCIVGVEAGGSRHAAMAAGEAGADYIGFDVSADGAGTEAAAGRVDMVAWWAEIFEVPCVAFGVADVATAVALADAGADFVSVRLAAGVSTAVEIERLVEIAAAVTGQLVDAAGVT